MQGKELKPKLRFKEFTNNWRMTYLSELGEFKNGINKSKDDFGFGVPFINLMDVFGKPVVSDLKLDLVNASSEEINTYNLKAGDVLFVRSSVKKEGVGLTSLVTNDLKDTVYSGFLIRFREKGEELDLNFKKYIFYNNNFRNRLMSFSSTSANTNINQESLNQLTINIPKKLEQQKIASFLSSVDSYIENLKQQKEALEKYKKGMMQKIFSRQIRFKPVRRSENEGGDDNGKEFPEWEEKKFKDLLSSLSTKRFQIKNSEILLEGRFPVIDQGQEKIAGYSNDNKKLFIDIPVIIFGDHTTILKYIDSPFVISADGTKILKVLNEKHNLKYVYYYLKFNQIKPEGYKRHFSLMNNLSFQIPNKNEQNKIANFLSKQDELIESKQQQIEKAEQWKKGLLQQLFI